MYLLVKLVGDAWYRKVCEGLPKVFGEEDPRLLNHYRRVVGFLGVVAVGETEAYLTEGWEC